MILWWYLFLTNVSKYKNFNFLHRFIESQTNNLQVISIIFFPSLFIHLQDEEFKKEKAGKTTFSS